MADVYATRGSVKYHPLTVDAWLEQCMPLLKESTATGGGIPLHRAGLVFYGGTRRKTTSQRSVMFQNVLRDSKGRVAFVDIADFLRFQFEHKPTSSMMAGVKGFNPVFLPLCNPSTNKGVIYSHMLFLFGGVASGTSSISVQTEDDVIISYFVALQCLAFQLSASDATEASAASLFQAISLVARAASLRMEDDVASQVIVTKLRNDDKAEDTLQRVLAALLLKTPPSPLGRLKMLENALKRNYKHHLHLHRSMDALRGVSSIVTLPPLLNALRLGVLTPEKAAGVLMKQRASLEAMQVAAAKDRAKTATHDANIVYCMIRGSGLTSVTFDFVRQLVAFCSEGRDRADASGTRMLFNRHPADFAAMGFGPTISSSTSAAATAVVTSKAGGGGAASSAS